MGKLGPNSNPSFAAILQLALQREYRDSTEKIAIRSHGVLVNVGFQKLGFRGESDVNNPIDSTDSDESSGRESDVALDWILRNHAEACRKEKTKSFFILKGVTLMLRHEEFVDGEGVSVCVWDLNEMSPRVIHILIFTATEFNFQWLFFDGPTLSEDNDKMNDSISSLPS
ncbi:hypothetical protein V6N13_014307 [Hibiscus sabdariffa]